MAVATTRKVASEAPATATATRPLADSGAIELERLRAENARLRKQAATPQVVRPAAAVPTPAPVRAIAISGSAWLTKVGGSSDLLRGLRVRLLPSNMPREQIIKVLKGNAARWRESQAKAEGHIKDAFDESGRRIAEEVYGRHVREAKIGAATADAAQSSLPASMDVLEAYRLCCKTGEYGLTHFDDAVLAVSLVNVKTDVNGKYIVPDVAPGQYYLQAEVDGGGHFIEWLIPVTAGGQDLSIDIENGTAVHIDNIK